MPKKTSAPEQIVATLRQIEVPLSQGKTVPQACQEAGIVGPGGCGLVLFL